MADEVNVSDAHSQTHDRKNRIAEVAGGATFFLVVRLGSLGSFENVVDVSQAWKLFGRMQLLVLLLDREIAGVVLVGIFFKCVTDVNDARVDV